MFCNLCPFLSIVLLFGAAVGETQDIFLGRHLTSCNGQVIEEFYNVGIDLEKFEGNCNDKDMYEMGKIIQDVVREVDQQVPENREDRMKTMMCAVPVAYYGDEDTRRFLRAIDNRRRKLGRYTYRGGGTCRRCTTDNLDRRLVDGNLALRVLGDEEYTSEAVCDMADTANVSKLKALAAAESLNEAVQEFTDIAQALQDEGKRENYIKKMKPKLQKCKENVESAVTAVELSKLFCEKSQKTNKEKEIKEYFKDTEKEAKRSLQYGEKAWDECWLAYSVVHSTTIDMKREINEQEFDLQMKTIKARNEEQKAAIGPAVSEIEDKIKELDEKMKNEKTEGSKQKYKKKIDDLEDEIKEITGSIEQANKLMVEEAKWEKEVTSLILDVEEEDDEKKWCDKFAKLIEEYAPQRLLQEYNIENGGCLDSDYKPNVKVEVHRDLQETEVVTSRDCDKY